MIPKKYRLRERDIDRIFKKGRPIFSQFWGLNSLENPRGQWHRLAVNISRKHDKRSARRNIYRRAIYDALLPQLKSPSTRHFHGILMLKKGLKLDKTVPPEWIEDAKRLFAKTTMR